MLSHANPSTVPSGKNLNLEYLFYNYILKMEGFYPGVLTQLSESAKSDDDDKPNENHSAHYTLGNRLFFNTFEISNAENKEGCRLTPLADEINTAIKEKRYHSLFKSLYKSIEAIEPSLTPKAIEQVITIQDAFIKKLLTPNYMKQLNTRLSSLIKDNDAREKAEKTIYNAIFFRCLAHTFTLKVSSSKKTNQRKLKQKFLTEIYTVESNDTHNTLISMMQKTKEKIVCALETQNLNDILDGKLKSSEKTPETSTSSSDEDSEKLIEITDEKSEQPEEKAEETPFIKHTKHLSTFIGNIKSRYEFIIGPSLTINHILNHLYALATHLQKKILPINRHEIKSLTAIVIAFIESHLTLIKADSESLVKAETIIKTIKEIAITEESEVLEKLQSHLEPSLQKIKLSINTPKQTRPPIPTTPSITLLGQFKKPKQNNHSSTERTMLIPKK